MKSKNHKYVYTNSVETLNHIWSTNLLIIVPLLLVVCLSQPLLNITKIQFSEPTEKQQISIERNASNYQTTIFYLKIYVLDRNTNKEEKLEECIEIPYKIFLSETENFEVGRVSGRKTQLEDNPLVLDKDHGCAVFELKIRGKAGLECNITIQYTDPLSGKVLKAHKSIRTYHALQAVYPRLVRNDHKLNGFPHFVLPIGATVEMIVDGGPVIEHGDNCCNQVEIFDPEVVKAATNITCGKYETGDGNNIYKYNVTCLSEGVTSFTVTAGVIGHINKCIQYN